MRVLDQLAHKRPTSCTGLRPRAASPWKSDTILKYSCGPSWRSPIACAARTDGHPPGHAPPGPDYPDAAVAASRKCASLAHNLRRDAGGRSCVESDGPASSACGSSGSASSIPEGLKARIAEILARKAGG
jgi:hypothetical protein